ncbi:MAG TPA: SpoIID/LytB domain-containing protein [Ignavibacteriaceae bacterium]|nr:SpoIID/LytB domain-containing protein [Ignavibacteriaceae bacterium]
MDNQIRVLLNSNNSLKIVIDKPANLFIENDLVSVLDEGTTINFSGSGMIKADFNNESYSAKSFMLSSATFDEPLQINSKSYNGFIKIVSFKGSLNTINVISLEDYLKGVIPSEMPVKSGEDYFEALKAFAICARTFSLQSINKSGLFDVHVDVRSQVYGGAGVENPISNRAVDETRGLILTYDNKPATVFYSSTCGGITEESKNVFSAYDIPYLTNVEDGEEPYCNISPNFNWTQTFTKNEIISKLAANGLIESDFIFTDMFIKSRFYSNHINQLIIVAEKNGNEKEVTLIGNGIRSILKTDKGILKSNNFEVSIGEDVVTLTGTGWGHGVGLCQWGSINMGKKGFTYNEILSHYFPGTKIDKLK